MLHNKLLTFVFSGNLVCYICLLVLSINQSLTGTTLTQILYYSRDISEHKTISIHNFAHNFQNKRLFHFQISNQDNLELNIRSIPYPFEIVIFSKEGKAMHSAMYNFQKSVLLDMKDYENGNYIVVLYAQNKRFYDYNLLKIAN
jgi:hypothetical protein